MQGFNQTFLYNCVNINATNAFLSIFGKYCSLPLSKLLKTVQAFQLKKLNLANKRSTFTLFLSLLGILMSGSSAAKHWRKKISCTH